MIRPLPLPILLPALAGCHLFASGTIGTTCEDLEGGCPGDTGPIDTSPVGGDYTVRSVLGARGAGGVSVRAIGPEGDVLLSVATDDSPSPGPVAWDEPGGRIFYYDNAASVLHVLQPSAGAVIDGYAPDTGAERIQAVDVAYVDSRLYVLAPTALYRVDIEGRTFGTLVPEGLILDGRSMVPSPDGAIWVLDLGGVGGLPDLWRVDLGSGDAVQALSDFDDGQGRAHAGFLGPGNTGWVCSALGSMYAVEDLLAGSRTPSAMPDPADMQALVGASFVDDVTDCGWDPSASRFLASSVSAGILGIDAWNSVDRRVAPVEGETPFHADFVPAPAAR